MFRRIFVWAAFAALLSLAPAPSAAASKEIQELQRDVAQLQDQLKQLQQSQDRQFDRAPRAGPAVACRVDRRQ